MKWLRKLFRRERRSLPHKGIDPEDVVRFYQELGFFAEKQPKSVVELFCAGHERPLDPCRPWDDVFLLRYSDGDVWTDDPEADVGAVNMVYSAVLPEWARISGGAFAPTDIGEHWESDEGPVTLTFQLAGKPEILLPRYLDDWIDLNVLQQINSLMASSGRQFECAMDVNYAVVLCLTREQKRRMQVERGFPFAW